ncbi:MAG TPA: hypothetical protein VFU37_17970 [Pyrinomonadaceae bacterium]|nr:hypothetical protein [Pyrinomonadaceae bacterium]
MKYRFAAVLLALLFATIAYGQVQFQGTGVAFPQIVVGGDLGATNYVTIIQLVNNNSASTAAHIALFGDTGSPLAVSFDGQSPQATMDVTLASGEARQIQLTLSGDITPGWLLTTYTPSDALATVILQLRAGSSIVSEVGVAPSFNVVSATDFSAETDSFLNTGIAIVNPSSTTTTYVYAQLWDPGTGTSIANTTITLAANAHYAKLLTEVFSNVPAIAQIRAKVSLDSIVGNGFVATALRLNGDQFTTIPVVQTPNPGDAVPTTRVLPQVAFGGSASGVHLNTVLYFTTTVSTGVFGTAQIFDDDGNPLAASADGAPPATSFTFTVPGNRVTRVVLTGNDTLRGGWILLTLPSSVDLGVSAIFQTVNGSTVTAEASVLESTPGKNGLVYVKQSSTTRVGVGFANSQTTTNTISLTLFNNDGSVFASRDITLGPNAHKAQFIDELFPQLVLGADFDGALAMHSSMEFAAMALRLTSGKLATLAVSSNGMYRPAITGLRITKAQRSPAQVNFDIDVIDLDSDLVVAGSTAVSAQAILYFGGNNVFDGVITIDGTSMLNRLTGTLSGTFVPSGITGTIPTGTQAYFLLEILDSASNESNTVLILITF